MIETDDTVSNDDINIVQPQMSDDHPGDFCFQNFESPKSTTKKQEVFLNKTHYKGFIENFFEYFPKGTSIWWKQASSLGFKAQSLSICIES